MILKSELTSIAARIISILLLICGSAGAQPSPERSISNKELLAEKRGKVVDADTGQGIADAFVVIKWITDSTGYPGLVSGGQWCDLQAVTTTEEDGSFFFVPIRRGQIDLSDRKTYRALTPWGLLSSTHDMSYRMYVYKAGYVRPGDESKISSAKLGGGVELEEYPPDAVLRGYWADLQSIPLRKQRLDGEGTWLYRSLMQRETRCRDRMAEARDAPLWRNLNDELRSGIVELPCDVSPKKKVYTSSVYALLGLIADPNFNKQLNLEIGGDVRNVRAPIEANLLCQATKVGGAAW